MKRILWIIVIVAIVLIGVWLWRSRIQPPGTEGLPQLPGVSDEDTTSRIQQDLDKIDLGDINKQFEEIDAQLNNL